MSQIRLKCDYPHSHVSVPCAFIDTYMTKANGEFVKVYLYLLRCMSSFETECSICAIADHLGYTEKDILRALKYWEKAGVLALELNEHNQLTGLIFRDLSAEETAQPVLEPEILLLPADDTAANTKAPAAEKTLQASIPAPAVPEKREYTMNEITAFHNNHELSELLFIVETYLKHPLTAVEMNTLFFWYDALGFPCELIEYLVEYCITNGHSSLRYMDKVAVNWAEEHINTIEKAKEQTAIRSKAYYSVIKAFGISGRALAESENAFVNKWTKEYAFDIPLIQEACRRTISATQKASFEYTDSILSKWHEHHVHNMNDVKALDEVFNNSKRAAKPIASAAATNVKRNKFNNFQQRSYDPGELEKLLLTTTV